MMAKTVVDGLKSLWANNVNKIIGTIVLNLMKMNLQVNLLPLLLTMLAGMKSFAHGITML